MPCLSRNCMLTCTLTVLSFCLEFTLAARRAYRSLLQTSQLTPQHQHPHVLPPTLLQANLSSGATISLIIKLHALYPHQYWLIFSRDLTVQSWNANTFAGSWEFQQGADQSHCVQPILDAHPVDQCSPEGTCSCPGRSQAGHEPQGQSSSCGHLSGDYSMTTL